MASGEGHCLGAHRAVLRLARRTGHAVGRADIDVLVNNGQLVPAGEFEGRPVYSVIDVDAIPAREVALIVTERLTWLQNSVDDTTTARLLGIRPRQIASQGLVAGRFGRYARVDVLALCAEAAPARPPAVWATAMLEPGAAVLLDTETARLGRCVCEVAVLDNNGQVLLNTVVKPTAPVDAATQQVHGITDADLVDAPTWPEVLRSLLDVTRDRVIVAYNADYDRGAILHDCAAGRLDAEHLTQHRNWECLLARRPDSPRPLGGPHRALGDCQAALELLRGIAAGTVTSQRLHERRRTADHTPP